MAFPKHLMLLLTVLFTVIMVVRSAIEPLEPHIVRAVRQATFAGRSPRQALFGTNNGRCDCQYLVTCASQLEQIGASCPLPGGVTGVCCPPVGGGNIGVRIGAGGSRRGSVLGQQSSPRATSNVDRNTIDSSCRKGIRDVELISQNEKTILRKGIILNRSTAANSHLRVFKTGPNMARKHKEALTIAMASLHIRSENRLSCDQLQTVDVKNSILSKSCPQKVRCTNFNSKYRTADGSCNNINNPEWGMSETALSRLLPPKYEDCVKSPRERSVTGKKLPLGRLLTNNVLIDNNKPSQDFTLSVMQWAQFMDHDLSLTPFPEADPNSEAESHEGIECCKDEKQLFPENSPDLNDACFPIEIPRNDGFYAPRNISCLNFVRSELVEKESCRFGPVEQVNVLTQWIDASTVYGQNQEDTNEVRSFSRGLLRTSGNNFLPIDENAPESECAAVARGGECFLAGESRVNEQPGLTLFHAIWLRQHNRIARQLQQLNSWWSDDAVFQETRRIIAAQISHITYNEWLPILVGNDFMERFGILPLRSGFSTDYNPNINANINNEFSTAAFRFGHSLVQGLIQLFSQKGSVSTSRLRDNFMTGTLAAGPGFLDKFIRGMTRQPSQTFDNFVTEDLTNHLFQTPQNDFGLDLMSLNIQRGRDHAIGTYNEARQLCGLGRASSFNDLLADNVIPPLTVKKLSQIYAHVDDIDMFVGGMSESAVFGGILGPTFICIIGDQFARLRKGDRYFYELGGQAGSFRLEQLQEIRRTSWARILCDNSDNLDEIQPLAFKLARGHNRRVQCSSPNIPQINLQFWRDQRPQG